MGRGGLKTALALNQIGNHIDELFSAFPAEVAFSRPLFARWLSAIERYPHLFVVDAFCAAGVAEADRHGIRPKVLRW